MVRAGSEAESLQGLVCGQRVSVVCAESRESHLGYLLPHTALHAAQPADGQPERFAVLYAHGGCEPVRWVQSGVNLCRRAPPGVV